MKIVDEELSVRGLPGEITISLTPEEIEALLKGECLEATGRETGLTVSICPQRTSDVIFAEVIEGENERLEHIPESEIQRFSTEVKRRSG